MRTKISRVTADSIVFDNGMYIRSYHGRECCEDHWLAFDEIESFDVDVCEFDLTGEFFERVPDYGIRLLPLNAQPIGIPGYGDNNGYYSPDIDLELYDEFGGEVARWDVTECQVDKYP